MNISELLHDAVDGVEPADRIAELRARTANRQRAAARPWFYAAGGVVLATAAAITAFAVLGDGPANEGHHDHHATDPPVETELVPAYFIGETPTGPRLYREFDQVPAGDPLQGALDRIERPAADPDYTTPWAEDSFGSVTLEDDGIHVELADPEAVLSDELAVQQVVYTLQGAAGGQLPVWFWRDGQRGSSPVSAEPQNDVLSLMSISDPAEGATYSGSFTARGRANSNESNVVWELQDASGEVVREGFTTAAGWMDRLYPWEAEIDLAGLPFGDYTFVALTDDPSGGTEGFGPFTDTRSITVR